MPDPNFYTRLTNQGSAALNAAITGGSSITLAEISLGDGNGASYDPDGSEATLVNEVHRIAISSIAPDPQNPAWLILEAIIPPDIGGWWIREAGVFDENGDLFAIAKYPPTYKAVLSDGTASTLTIQVVLQITNTDTINLVVNPLDGYATQGWVLSVLPWATDPQVLDPALENHVVDPKRLHLALAVIRDALADHDHEIEDVSGLQEALDLLSQSLGSTQANVDDLSQAFGSHSHDLADIAGLSAALSAKANTDHTHALPSATTTQRGIVELATQAELDAGTDNVKAITAKLIKNMDPASPVAQAIKEFSSGAPDAILLHETAQGTAAGSVTANQWKTRPINVEQHDPGGIVTVTNPDFTVTKDCYLLFHGHFAANGRNQFRIYNVTDDAVVAHGLNGYVGSGVDHTGMVAGFLEAGKSYRIDHFSTGSHSSGMGRATGLDAAVHSHAALWRA